MGSKITGAGGPKYRTLLVKQGGQTQNTAITLYTATRDCLMYIWGTSGNAACIKINGTATTSNYSAKLENWVYFNHSDEDIEHHVEMCGADFIKLYLNEGDYVSLIGESTSWVKVQYRVLV